jgi:hypothetical protein
MIAIILSTCLVNDPGICRDQTLPLAAEVSEARCVIMAPPYLAQWCEEHPQWRVVRWRCRSNGEREI